MPSYQVRDFTPPPTSKYKIVFPAKRAVNRMTTNSATAMKKIAKQIEMGIKSLTPVDTGRLKSNYKVKFVGPRGKNPKLVVTGMNYSGYVEFGTVNMDAQPHIRPIVVGQRANWERALAREARRAGKGRKKI